MSGSTNTLENREKQVSGMNCPFCWTTKLLWERVGDRIRVFCESCDHEHLYTQEWWEGQLAWEKHNWHIYERSYFIYTHEPDPKSEIGCSFYGFYVMMEDEEDFPTFEARIKKEYLERSRNFGCLHEFEPVLQKRW